MERQKVVYQEPGQEARAIIGVVEDAGEFLKVGTERGEMTINKKIVFVIKAVRAGRGFEE